jgi:type I restriction enzyme S subunit
VLSPTNAPFAYLYQAVTTEEFAAYLTNHATGAAYPAVNAQDFEQAQVLRPTRDLLDRYQEIAAPIAWDERTRTSAPPATCSCPS